MASYNGYFIDLPDFSADSVLHEPVFRAQSPGLIVDAIDADWEYPLSTSYTNNLHSSAPTFYTYGYVIDEFYNHLYGRVYIRPSSFSYPLILSDIEETFEIWVADLDNGRILSVVNEINTDGTSVDYIAPWAFPPNGTQIYTLQINTDGPPNINAEYQFDFGTEVLSLTVQGKTLIIYANEPQGTYAERYTWKTAISESRTGKETLHALRQRPRRTLTYNYKFLTEEDREKIINLISAVQYTNYGTPEWRYYTPLLSDIAISDTEIYFDLSAMPLDVGYSLILINDEGQTEGIEIASIEADHIVSKFTLLNNFSASNTYVMPLLISRLSTDIKYAISILNKSELPLNYEITDSPLITPTNLSDQYNGYDVLMDKSIVPNQGTTLDILSFGERLDYDVGNFNIYKKLDHSKLAFTFKVWAKTKAEIEYWKGWIYKLKGQQGCFYLPLRSKSYRIAENIGLSDTDIQIEPANLTNLFNKAVAPFHVLFEMSNGDRYFREVSSVTNFGTYETVSIVGNFGVAYNKEDVQMSRLVLVRSMSDSFEFKYSRMHFCEIDFKFIEVFQ